MPQMYKPPTNKEIAALLNSIADALEIKSEDQFRVRAYRNGARNVESLEIEAADAVSQGRLDLLPGIGKRLGALIDEFVRTGESGDLASAREGIPPGVFELLSVPGIGPKTAGRFLNELQVEDLDRLEEAARAGRIRALQGMGAKREERILAEVGRVRERRGRRILADAVAEAAGLIEALREAGLETVALAGDARRGTELVSRIDLLAASGDRGPALDIFERLGRPVERGPDRAMIATARGTQARLRVVDPGDFGAALFFATGSEGHVRAVAALAVEKGLALGEEGSNSGLALEETIYERLGLQYVPPELREGSGEIEAALRSDLPVLLTLEDVRGDLHVHTRWSDGAHSIEEMATAARALGCEYLAITDHSASLSVAHGLDLGRLMEQKEAVASARGRVEGIEILHGTEVDILPDGSLDFPDEALAGLDWVTASVHSAFRQPREVMTARIVRALRNANVDSMGHLTGRLLNGREGYELDVDAVLRACAQSGTALEINAMPDRLDVSDAVAREAARLGVKLVINTDAHSIANLDYMRFGVTAARRGWLTRSDVLNARDLEGLRRWRVERRDRAAR